MTVTRSYILRAVRARLGLDPEPVAAIADVCDCSQITDALIIEEFIAASTVAINSAAATDLVSIAVPFTSADIFWESMYVPDGCRSDRRVPRLYSGRVALPGDFLRLVPLRMSDWSREAVEVTDDASLSYRLMTLRHPAFSGNPSRPVCRVERTPQGCWLKFSACRSTDASVECGGYVTYPKFDAHGGIDLPMSLLPEIIDVTVESLKSVNSEV